MTNRPRRMDGYIRVSRRMGREGPGYISPTVQRDAIQRWADYRGVEIVAWHEDEDESGGTQDRPGMREAMRRVLENETDGIACWRLNRFARNVSEALGDVKRIHSRKPEPGHLAFVEEDIDPTGPFGEFILTMLLAVAALELNNLKASWRTAKERAVQRGAKIGPTPYGYAREEDGTLVPHPEHAEHVREAFTRAGRESLHAATAYLEAHAPGRTWTAYTARRMLANRSYLGEQRYGGRKDGEPSFTNLSAHPALVTRLAWEKAQREEPAKRMAAAAFPLSGVATCAACGEILVGGRGGSDARRTYRCRAGLKTWKGARCPAPAVVTASTLEEHVLATLRARYEAANRKVAVVVGEEDEEAAETLEALQEALEAAEADRDEFLADTTARRILGSEGYHAALQAHVDAVEVARQQYLRGTAQVREATREVTLDALDALEPDELGEVLRGALESCVLSKGRGRIAERVRVRFVGEADDGEGVAATVGTQ